MKLEPEETIKKIHQQRVKIDRDDLEDNMWDIVITIGILFRHWKNKVEIKTDS